MYAPRRREHAASPLAYCRFAPAGRSAAPRGLSHCGDLAFINSALVVCSPCPVPYWYLERETRRIARVVEAKELGEHIPDTSRNDLDDRSVCSEAGTQRLYSAKSTLVVSAGDVENR